MARKVWRKTIQKAFVKNNGCVMNWAALRTIVSFRKCGSCSPVARGSSEPPNFPLHGTIMQPIVPLTSVNSECDDHAADSPTDICEQRM